MSSILNAIKNATDYELTSYHHGCDNDVCREIIVRLEKRTAERDEARATTRDMVDSEGGWIWGGDEEDHLESIACPIVISPEQLREIIKQSENKETDL